MNSSGTLRDVWSLVLAGGNGERLGPLVQRWLGHAQLSTTAIYAEAVGQEEQEIAARMWG